MKHDRFLIAILVIIALIAALAVGAFFLRQSGQEYATDETADGALTNYILALQKADYQRAYTYLADGEGKPEYARFRQAYLNREMDVATVAVQIGQVQLNDGEAFIPVTILHEQRGLFSGSGFREMQTAVLVRGPSGWKISSFSYPFWGWDWYTTPIPAEKVVPPSNP